MNEKEKAVTGYIHRITKGFVAITPDQARYIIKLATRECDGTVLVEKFEFKSLKNSYELIKVFQVQEDQVKTIFHKWSRTKIEGFYRYDYKDKTGAVVASIYNLNASLFDN